MEDQNMKASQMTGHNQPQPPKSAARKALLITIIVVAIGCIIWLGYIIMNQSGVETSSNEAVGTVTLSDSGVTPAVITIKNGDSVTWVNESIAAHNIELTTPDAPKELEGFGTVEPLLNGESYSFIFEASGTFTYDDPNSPAEIQGTIVVEDY